MKPASLFTSTFTLSAALILPAAASATDGNARIRYVEPGLSVQGVLEPAPAPGVPNLPWLPGDRAWTDATGRAEVQFLDGSVLQLAQESRVDYTEYDAGGGRALVAVRLWTGSVYMIVQGQAEGPTFEIETPDGVVYIQEAGVYRIDVVAGETRTSVFRGAAEISSASQRVALYSGERSYLQPGRAPEAAQRFDHQSLDAFDAWSRSRQDARSATYAPPGLPTEVAPYASELAQYGSWSVVADVGYVWSPRVSVGWQPYARGRWAAGPRGWAWVGYEPWGWAPYHYGRWGHSVGLGWYWIPGSTWSGAWVSWSIGGGNVGWCPMGRYGRPVRVRHHGRGHRSYHGHDGGAWQYARETGLGAHDLSRHRVRGNPGAEMRTLAANQQPHQRGRFAVPRSAFSSAPRERAVRAQSNQSVTRARTRPQAGARRPRSESRPSTSSTPPRTSTRRAVEPRVRRSDVLSDSAGNRRRPSRNAQPQRADREQPADRRSGVATRETPRARTRSATPAPRARSGRESRAPARVGRAQGASRRAPEQTPAATNARKQDRTPSASRGRSGTSSQKTQKSASGRKARKRER
jgi:hypothetical protein